MANFNINGMDALEIDLRDLAKMSDEERWSILEAGALPVKAKMQEVIDRMFGTDGTGDLRNSITVQQKTKDGSILARITPRGRHKSSGRGIRMKKRKDGTRAKSGKYSGSNAEVGYYLEYGTPRIAPRHWMETADEESGEESKAAMEAAFDEILKSKGF